MVMKTSAWLGRTTLTSSDGHVFSRVRTNPVIITANCGRPRAPAAAVAVHVVDLVASSTAARTPARAIAMASCSSTFAFDSAFTLRAALVVGAYNGRRACFLAVGCGGVRLRVRTAILSATASPAVRTTSSVSCTQPAGRNGMQGSSAAIACVIFMFRLQRV